MSPLIIILLLLIASFALAQNPLVLQSKDVLVLPVSIFFGWSFSPFGVFPVLPSTLLELTPAVHCAIIWTCFIAGTRTRYSILLETRTWLRSLSTFALTLALFACAYLLLSHPLTLINDIKITTISFDLKLAAAGLVAVLFSGSSLISSLPHLRAQPQSPHLDNFKTMTATLLIWLVFYPLNYSDKFRLLAALITGVLMCGFVLRLLLPREEKLTTPHRLTLAGVLCLLAGYCIGYSLWTPIVGYLTGNLSSQWMSKHFRRDLRIIGTEGPFKILISFCAGLYLNIDLYAMLIGILLGLMRYLFKHSIQRKAFRERQAWKFSGVSLSIALGIHLTNPQQNIGSFLINAVIAGLLTTDFLFLLEKFFFLRMKFRWKTSVGGKSGS